MKSSSIRQCQVACKYSLAHQKRRGTWRYVRERKQWENDKSLYGKKAAKCEIAVLESVLDVRRSWLCYRVFVEGIILLPTEIL
jgi:hypothetical protein